MRQQYGRDEVLVVTYTNGDVEQFRDAKEMGLGPQGSTAIVAGDRVLAHLVLANVRKWEWVKA